MRRLLIPLVAHAATALACTEPEPLGTRLGIEYAARGPYADLTLFSAVVTHGSERRELRGSDLTIHTQAGGELVASVERLPLDAGVPTTVRVAVVLAPGDTAAAGEVSWMPELNWVYGVSGVVEVTRPQGQCFDVVDAIPLPPRNGVGGDTLFVVQSALPQGSVC